MNAPLVVTPSDIVDLAAQRIAVLEEHRAKWRRIAFRLADALTEIRDGVEGPEHAAAVLAELDLVGVES